MAAVGKSTLGRALQWDALRSYPILQTSADYTYTHIHTYWLQTITHTHTYLPTPDPSPPSLWTASLTSGSGPALILAAGPDGWLPELDYFPCCKVVCLWCIMCFCCWGVFPVLTLYSPRSIVWGLFFFLLTFLMLCYAVFFFNSLSSCPVYPLVIYVVYVWTGWWLISLVLVTSDNKGLLLLLLLLLNVEYSFH